LKNINRKRKKT